MNKNLLYLFLIVLVGCSKGEKKSSKVLFAGEIVNPTSDYVVLYKGEEVIDSAKLNVTNRFAFDLDSIGDGLYHFNHDPEYQYVYLEKGDSLMLRLNTIDFDESLVFSGSGEEVNNFMINLFLSNEDEEKLMYRSYYNEEPQDFEKRLDSLRDGKLMDLKTLRSETQLSQGAYEIVEASIDYTYYNYKERYPFEHKQKRKIKTVPELPLGFYDYRSAVDYNNTNLNYLKPYYDFMQSHFGNLSYMSCSHECDVLKDHVKNQLHFNRHKLKLIDSLVQDQELKDNLFRNVAFNYLLNGRDIAKNNQTFIEEFHELSGNNRHIAEIDDLYQGIKNIQPQNEIPNVFVLDSVGNRISLQEIAKDKKMVFYFWSGTERERFNDIVQRVRQLSNAKPEYTFVGINIKTEDTNWKGLMESAGLNKAHQYRSDNFSELTRALIVYPLNKCIITDNAKIVDAFATLYTSF